MICSALSELVCLEKRQHGWLGEDRWLVKPQCTCSVANSAELTADLPGIFCCEVALDVDECFRISLKTVGFVGSCMTDKRVLAAVSAEEFLLQVIVGTWWHIVFLLNGGSKTFQLAIGGEGCFLGLLVTCTGIMLPFFLCLK